jgi:hypothetical protein
MEQKYVYDLHSDHKEWLNKVNFYKDDLKVLRHRLSEILLKNSSIEVRAMAEHFQNQYILQDERADILRHDVNISMTNLEASINGNPTAVDHRKVNDENELRDAVETFERIFSELRQDSINFFAKWM